MWITPIGQLRYPYETLAIQPNAMYRLGYERGGLENTSSRAPRLSFARASLEVKTVRRDLQAVFKVDINPTGYGAWGARFSVEHPTSASMGTVRSSQSGRQSAHCAVARGGTAHTPHQKLRKSHTILRDAADETSGSVQALIFCEPLRKRMHH